MHCRGRRGVTREIIRTIMGITRGIGEEVIWEEREAGRITREERDITMRIILIEREAMMIIQAEREIATRIKWKERDQGTNAIAVFVQQTEESFLAGGASGSCEVRCSKAGMLLIALSLARRSNSKILLVIAAMPLSIVSPCSYG